MIHKKIIKGPFGWPLLIAILMVMSISERCVHAGTPLTLYQSFAGNINYVTIGGTLRTQPNSLDACLVKNDDTESLSGIPSGAAIKAAYLYWAGSYSTAPGSTRTTPDYSITFESQSITADRTFTETFVYFRRDYDYFSGFKDVTMFVAGKGNGMYTFADLSVNYGAPHCASEAVVAGWAMVVIYEHPGEHFRVINVFDGFQYYRGSQITLTLSNFRIPSSPINGKHTHISWEGDEENSGPLNGFSESLLFNGYTLTDTYNPANNQFNSTINTLGISTSYGVDIDTYDISAYLSAGDTFATTIYRSGADLVLLSSEIISVTNTPVADLAISKTHTGSFTVGENGIYRFIVSNNGPNDENHIITVTDTLPPGLNYASSSGSGWTVDTSAAPTITWMHPGPLPAGEGLPTITLTVSVDPSAVPNITNTATVSSPTFDHIASNNSSSDTASVLGPGAANKPLYIYEGPGLELSRMPPAGSQSSEVIRGNGGSVTWAMIPAISEDLTLTADVHPVRLWISRNSRGSSRTVKVALASIGATTGPIGTPVTKTFTIPPGFWGVTEIVFNVNLPSEYTLGAGSQITLTVTNDSASGNRSITIYPVYSGNNSRIDLSASSLIDISTVDAYDAPYPGGSVITNFLPISSAYIRAVVNDPFGSFDITSASIDIIDPNNLIIISEASMAEVFDSGSSYKIYEYVYTMPEGPSGIWSAIVKANEGTEGLVNDQSIGTFVLGIPDLLVMKTVLTIYDPYNGNLNPKAIPGAIVLYTIHITNQGNAAVDTDTLVITDPIPAHTSFFVNDIAGPNSGPLLFMDGIVPSGLTYTFISLDSTADDIDFSNDGGSTYTYIPAPDMDGYDNHVSHIRIFPKGAFLGSPLPPAPSFDLRFKVRVQ